jgi:hypothetical protein
MEQQSLSSTSSEVHNDRLKDALGPYIERFTENYQRAQTLVDMYDSFNGLMSQKGQWGLEDILRAAVVFAHAALEDFLRTLAVSYLPVSPAKALERIPLKGIQGGSEKFGLSALVEWRGKTVDDLIRESVEGHFARSSFSNITEIVTLLVSIGFDKEPLESTFPDIEEMILRRHQIVHRADHLSINVHDTATESIEPSEVRRWIGAIRKFTAGITYQMGQKVLESQLADFSQSNSSMLRSCKGVHNEDH